MTPYVILGVMITFFILNSFASKRFNLIKQQARPTKYSGEDIAKKIIEVHKLSEVTFRRGEKGDDHYYHPVAKYIQFGPEVYNVKNTYSVAIGAHEACHAVDYQVYRLLIVYIAKISHFIFIPSLIAAFFLDYSWLHSVLLWTYILIVAFKGLINTLDEIKMNRMAFKMLKEIPGISKEEVEATKQVFGALSWTYITGAPVAVIL